MKGLIVIFGCLMISVFLEGCRGLERDSIVTAYREKKVEFPDKLMILEESGLVTSALKITEFESKNTIVSIVDGSCMSCVINQLNHVDSVLTNVFSKDQVKIYFVLNVPSGDSSYFMINLRPAIDVQSTILWDSDYTFERTNDLITSDLNRRTFLLNSEMKIVEYGNPVWKPGIV